MSLNELAKKFHQRSRDNGFYDEIKTEDRYINDICNNFHNEISELHESWRNNLLHLPCDKAEKMMAHDLTVLTSFEEELADIIIRALDVAGYYDIDIDHCVDQKDKYNATREKRHGNKRS